MFRHLFPIALIACGNNNKDSDIDIAVDSCQPGENSDLEIGHGDLSFTAIDGADTQVELIYGPQGGYHSNIAVRARHIDPDAAYNLVLTGSIDGEVMAETVPWLSFRCNRSAEALQSTGSLLIWDAEPEELHGQVTQVSAELYDPAQEDPEDSELALKVASSSTEYTIWDLNLE